MAVVGVLTRRDSPRQPCPEISFSGRWLPFAPSSAAHCAQRPMPKKSSWPHQWLRRDSRANVCKDHPTDFVARDVLARDSAFVKWPQPSGSHPENQAFGFRTRRTVVCSARLMKVQRPYEWLPKDHENGSLIQYATRCIGRVPSPSSFDCQYQGQFRTGPRRSLSTPGASVPKTCRAPQIQIAEIKPGVSAEKASPRHMIVERWHACYAAY